MRFTQGYVTAPFCSASRAGLLTGQYQTRFGYEFNPIGHRNEDPLAGLPPSQRTLADALRRVGYATALLGKWHLGAQARNHPYRRGFDEFFGFLHEGHYFAPPPYRGVTTMLRRRRLPDGGHGRWTRHDGQLILSTHMGYDEPAYDANNPILRGGQPVVEDEYLTDALTREALDFLDRTRDRPYFLYLSYNAVHSPLQAPARSLEKLRHIPDVHRRIFLGMLERLDNSVGAVLNKVRQLDQERKTLIFFLSDNGGPTRELTSSNAPLRGEKGQVYEGGIRVPFMVQWTGVLPAGRVDRRPVISLDVFATSVAVAGAQPPAKLDGRNLVPLLANRQSEVIHPQLFWRTGDRMALRSGPWKVLRNPTRRSDQGRWEMYHLEDDPAESTNLATSEPERLKQLVDQWRKWNAEMKDPIWTP